MKRIHIMTAGTVYAILSAGSISAFGQPEKASLTVQSVQTVTRGFPCILKIEIGGPAHAPTASLHDELASIRIELTASTNHQTYRIGSSRGMDITVTSADGIRRDNIAEQMWQVPVSAGTKRSILLDLASLRPEFGQGTVFTDVPPGEYDVKVRLPGVSAQATALRMKVVTPTEDEQQCLSDLKQDCLVRNKALIWSRVLGSGIRLPRDKWDRLSPTTKEQTAFHMLLADLLAPDKTLGPGDENTVKATPLPKFLEPERECLLHEVRMATGKSDEAEASRLMKQYPDLEWRLQDIKTGKKSFLRNKKAAANKDKPASN